MWRWPLTYDLDIHEIFRRLMSNYIGLYVQAKFFVKQLRACLHVWQKHHMRQKQGGITCSAAVNQLGFDSATAQDVTPGVSCDGAAKLELTDSCTVRIARFVFVACDILSHIYTRSKCSSLWLIGVTEREKKLAKKTIQYAVTTTGTNNWKVDYY